MCPPAATRPTAPSTPKFGQKLDFIERMTRWSEGLREPTIILGDFNVAPLECDVWSHKALLTVVSHTPVEVDALTRLRQAHDWIDIGRKFVPAPERCFTWWSYRSPDWTKNDRGRRLDHMWASPELAGHLKAHSVLEPCRNWQRPSDHVPLIRRDRGLSGSAVRTALPRSAPGARSGSTGHARRQCSLSRPRARSCSTCSIPGTFAKLLISGERAAALNLANERDAADPGAPVVLGHANWLDAATALAIADPGPRP